MNNILINRWTMLFIMIGFFILFLPGAALYGFGHENVGRALMWAYCIPLLIWAVLVLFIGLIEFIKQEF